MKKSIKDPIEVTEPGRHGDYISIVQDNDCIVLSPDGGLELAYLLMTICKGQGSGQVYTLPKDKTK